MEKEIFEKAFIDSLNKNFQSCSKYFDFHFYSFSELGLVVFEIIKCLILELYRASITLTINLLERLLKLSLIYNEVGVGPKPVESWSSIYEAPNKKYNSISLENSIEKCRKHGLITENEKVYLFDSRCAKFATSHLIKVSLRLTNFIIFELWASYTKIIA